MGRAVSPLDVSRSLPISDASEFETWLRDHGGSEREVIVAIFKKSSGRQTVTLDDLQEAALCHGWIDFQGQRVDEERWAIRFAPRRPGSNWSARNRQIARRLLAEGRMAPAGLAKLPADL